TRKIPMNASSGFVNERHGRIMLLGQRNQDISVGRARDSGIGVGQIDAAVRKADVIYDSFELFLRDLLAKRSLNLVHTPCNLFNPCTALHPEMQRELPRIDQREKILTEPRNQKHRCACKTEKQNRDGKRVAKAHRQQIAIGLPKLLKPFVEFSTQSPKNSEYPIL